MVQDKPTIAGLGLGMNRRMDQNYGRNINHGLGHDLQNKNSGQYHHKWEKWTEYINSTG